MVLNSALYFTATDPERFGALRRVPADGSAPEVVADMKAQRTTVFDGKVYFSGHPLDDEDFNSELYRTDGTAAGTMRVADVFGGRFGFGPRSLTPCTQALYLNAFKRSTGREVYAYRPQAVGVGEAPAVDEVVVYPNPFSKHLTIEGAYEHATLYDVAGRVVAEGSPAAPLTVASLAAGVYELRVFAEGQYATRTVVKQ